MRNANKAMLVLLCAVAIGTWLGMQKSSQPQAEQPLAPDQLNSENPVAGSLGHDPLGTSEPLDLADFDSTRAPANPTGPIEKISDLDIGVMRIFGASGEHLVGAQIGIGQSPWTASNFSATDGRVEIALPVAAIDSREACDFWAWAPGHALKHFVRQLEEGHNHLGEIILERGGEIQGQVIDAFGQPAATALVIATRSNSKKAAKKPNFSSIDLRPLGRAGLPLTTRIADKNGRFSFTGLDSGYWTIWTVLGSRPWTASCNLELGPALPTQDITAILAHEQPNDHLHGVLLGLGGDPVAGARVSIGSPEVKGFTMSLTDPLGRFFFEVPEEVLLPLSAPHSKDQWDWGPARIEQVHARAQPWELRFSAARWMWVRVVDETGVAVTSGQVRGAHVDRSIHFFSSNQMISDLWGDGRARLHEAQGDFTLSVSAAGYESQPFGPYSTSDLPMGSESAPLELVVASVPAFRGLVTQSAEPVANAKVWMIVTKEGYEVELTKWKGIGDPFEQVGSPDRSFHSGRKGYFRIPHIQDFVLDSKYGTYLLAEKEDVGSGIIGPFPFPLPEGEHSIELLPYGAIEGTLHLSTLDSPAAWIVMARDILGSTISAVCSEGGKFRLSGLRPGEWQLRALRPNTDKPFRDRGFKLRDSAKDIPFEALVKAGEITSCDVHASPLPLIRVEGSLRLVGDEFKGPLGPWRYVLKGSHQALHGHCDPEGRFQFELELGSQVLLTLTSLEPDRPQLIFFHPFEAEQTRLDLVITLGRIECSGETDRPKIRGLRLHQTWPDGSELSQSWDPDVSGSFPATWVPAGPSKLIILPQDRNQPLITQTLTIPSTGVLQLTWD